MNFDDPEEPTDVEQVDDVLELVIESAAPTGPATIEIKHDVTKPHDGGEWLAGFRKGVATDRIDVRHALMRVLGEGDAADAIIKRVFEILGPES